ncbi:MAG: hypothetical protein JO043_13550 [Candidatus Eremiobacteraeota bacterium]|nr:hypothetical protein [Candidatus Eremiobacteraeota bacterium]
MRAIVLGCYARIIGAAAALLAGCGGSQPTIVAPDAMLQSAASVPRAHQHAVLGNSNPALTTGIYVSEDLSRRSGIFGYPSDNRKNRGPICSQKAQPTYDIAVDNGGNLIVPNSDGTITVFQGPDMCGRKLGTFHTIYNADYPVDASSPDAANGTIAVGIEQLDGSGDGIVELCTLKSGCTTSLTGGGSIDFLFAVAMSKKGDCWASSAVPTALTYWAGCAGLGQPTTGYENSDAGGLDIDNNGNLVSISCSPVNCSTPVLYVYSGCNPGCKRIGGPFPLHGRSQYGHLNGNSSRFAAADYEVGQIDIYRYTPTSLTYLYTFSHGLSGGGRMGVAYNPRSKE